MTETICSKCGGEVELYRAQKIHMFMATAKNTEKSAEKPKVSRK